MGKLLDAFAEFSADWFLEEGFWGELLVQIPRKVDKQSNWVLGIYQGNNQEFGILIGSGFLALEDFAKKTWTKLCIYHLCLGHPIQIASVAVDPIGHLAAILRGINLLNEQERAIFPQWNAMLQDLPLPTTYSLLEVKDQIKEHNLLEKVNPSLIAEALEWHQAWQRNKTSISPIESEELEDLGKQSARLASQYGEQTLSKLLELTRKTSKQGKLSWQQILRNEIMRTRKRRIVVTQKRPSKRYGITPGIKLLPHMHLAVILDTSASISTEQLDQFRNEVKGIYQSGSKITILEADVIVQRTYLFQGYFRDQNSYGRGGTSFDVAISQAEQILKADLIIYFTDGQGPTPQTWSGTPIIWCLSDTNAAHLPGKKLYL